ncbi:MAG: antibiotic biosynthesis monooxygenase [Ginsengibacter sp.]
MEYLTLSIKFTAKPENSAQFKQVLIDLFNTISAEPNFINATIHEAVGKPAEFLVYETWNDTIEHFLNVQMKEPYAIAYEQTLIDMDIKRQPAAYIPFAYFGTHLVNN